MKGAREDGLYFVSQVIEVNQCEKKITKIRKQTFGQDEFFSAGEALFNSSVGPTITFQ